MNPKPPRQKRCPHCGKWPTTFSPRETQIIELVKQGMTTSRIARALFLDARTIGTYRRRIADKLGLKSTQDLMYYLLTKGPIPHEDSSCTG